MRLRSRARSAQQVVTSVLSNAAEGHPARPPVTGTSEDIQTSAVGTQRAPAALTANGNTALHAFWSKSDLVLVVPDPTSPNGVRFRRQKAEHSCFIHVSQLEQPAEFHRMLNSHPSVRRAVWEDDWLRVCWHDRDQLRVYCKALLEKKQIRTFEGMVSPVLRHLVDYDIRPAAPRQLWIDIETDSRVPFRLAIEGGARILSWAAVDVDDVVVATGLLQEDTDADEKRLLVELWNVLDRYDQIIAWSGDRFDFPVIKERSNKHELLRPSEREWRRWLWLDHLELFKRMNMNVSESGDEKQSFKLNSVAQSILGEGKDDFDSSKTWEAWCAGGAERARLMKYNVQDTRLMVRIEAKTGYIRLLQTVADACGTFPDSRGAQPGVQVEGFLARLAHSIGHKFPTVLKTAESMKEQDQYLGAYVMHPQKNAGILRDVHVADFAALYPSIIRTWNMSPETLVESPDGILPLAHSPLTGFNFRTDKPGILPEAVKQLMALRKEWNDKKAVLPPGTEEWKDADRRAGAYKIAANSFYGVIGAATSRFYDKRVAESVTQCGKWLIIETIKAAEIRGMKVVYGDTDSLFVVGATRSEFEDFVKWCNTSLYPQILQEQGCVENIIKLAYEKQFERLIFTTAKRYVGNYVHYKGAAATGDSAPEIKGLEFKRGDSLRMTRQMQQEVAYLLAGYKQPYSENPEDYEAIIDRWLTRVLEDRLELDDVLISKRVNKELEDYKTDNPMTRIAKQLSARGRDVGEGAKIDYVVTNASISPQVVIPAEDYDPDVTEIDRMALWDKHVWPPTARLLQAAFPGHPWAKFAGLVAARKKAEKARQKAKKDEAKAAERLANPPKRKRKPWTEKEQEKVEESIKEIQRELLANSRPRFSRKRIA